MTVAYEGTAYAGFQRQPNGITIQEKIEEALERIAGEVKVVGAGRTDAGVHAEGQVVHFDSDTRHGAAEILRSANFYLPKDIAALSCEEADPSFHARYSAKGKRYRYTVWNDPVRPVLWRTLALHVPEPLDLGAMRAAAAPLLGTRDFSSFASEIAPGGNAVRTVSSLDPSRDGPRLLLDVGADGFLYNMVRAIAGTLLEVGRGRRPAAWVADVLAARDRRAAGPTAPARGLTLVRVDY